MTTKDVDGHNMTMTSAATAARRHALSVCISAQYETNAERHQSPFTACKLTPTLTI